MSPSKQLVVYLYQGFYLVPTNGFVLFFGWHGNLLKHLSVFTEKFSFYPPELLLISGSFVCLMHDLSTFQPCRKFNCSFFCSFFLSKHGKHKKSDH